MSVDRCLHPAVYNDSQRSHYPHTNLTISSRPALGDSAGAGMRTVFVPEAFTRHAVVHGQLPVWSFLLSCLTHQTCHVWPLPIMLIRPPVANRNKSMHSRGDVAGSRLCAEVPPIITGYVTGFCGTRDSYRAASASTCLSCTGYAAARCGMRSRRSYCSAVRAGLCDGF